MRPLQLSEACKSILYLEFTTVAFEASDLAQTTCIHTTPKYCRRVLSLSGLPTTRRPPLLLIPSRHGCHYSCPIETICRKIDGSLHTGTHGSPCDASFSNHPMYQLYASFLSSRRPQEQVLDARSRLRTELMPRTVEVRRSRSLCASNDKERHRCTYSKCRLISRTSYERKRAERRSTLTVPTSQGWVPLLFSL